MKPFRHSSRITSNKALFMDIHQLIECWRHLACTPFPLQINQRTMLPRACARSSPLSLNEPCHRLEGVLGALTLPLGSPWWFTQENVHHFRYAGWWSFHSATKPFVGIKPGPQHSSCKGLHEFKWKLEEKLNFPLPHFPRAGLVASHVCLNVVPQRNVCTCVFTSHTRTTKRGKLGGRACLCPSGIVEIPVACVPCYPAFEVASVVVATVWFRHATVTACRETASARSCDPHHAGYVLSPPDSGCESNWIYF